MAPIIATNRTYLIKNSLSVSFKTAIYDEANCLNFLNKYIVAKYNVVKMTNTNRVIIAISNTVVITFGLLGSLSTIRPNKERHIEITKINDKVFLCFIILFLDLT